MVHVTFLHKCQYGINGNVFDRNIKKKTAVKGVKRFRRIRAGRCWSILVGADGL